MKYINFLTDAENEIYECLNKATEMFDQLCADDPQHPADSYNFGHYIDAAKNAVLIRGARRIDPDHLMPKHDTYRSNVLSTYEDKLGPILSRSGTEVKSNVTEEGNRS